MSLVTQRVPNLLGGVSQMPSDQKLPNQMDILENALLSPTYGLRKRPPTETVGTISTSQTGFDTAFIHSVNRTPSERYTVVIANGTLKVFDAVTGLEQTVTFPNGTSYISGSSRGYRAFTVGDHTFIVNRQKEVKQGAKFAATQPHEALLFIRQVDFSTFYQVTLDGEFIQVWTVAETSAENRVEVSTNSVTQLLYDALISNRTGIPTKFEITLIGSTIHVKRKDGSAFSVAVSDGLSDKGLRLVKGSVQSIEDLPARARSGMVIEIAGNPGSTKDNSWVKYERSLNVFDVGYVPGKPISPDGVWTETTAPGAGLDLNASTMPHELVRQGFMTPIKAAQGVPRQPTWRSALGTETTHGWTADGNDVALAGTAAAAKVVIGEGAVRSSAITNSHPTDLRKVRVAYDLDTGDEHFATEVQVVLSASPAGGAWVEKATAKFWPGRYQDQLFELDMVCDAATRFELKLVSPVVTSTLYTKAASRKPRLTAHGSVAGTGARNSKLPGIRINSMPSTKISLGTVKEKWPKGAVVALTLNGVAFTYTLADDQLTSVLHENLAALIDAHASFTATAPPVSGAFIVDIPLNEFSVSSATSGDPPAVTVATCTFNEATKMWSPVLAMTPGEHVGRILKNITDGSEGVITSNSATAFEVTALTGGVSNTFKPDDKCGVMNTGSAYFVFRQAPWSLRTAGNDELSPFPSFVNRQINDVFFHAGRLGFTSKDFVVLSAAGDLYRFFRETVTKVLDADPIDVQSAHKDVAFLDSAIQWEGNLFLSSPSGHQFILTGDPIVSPATVRLEHLTSYPSSEKVRPIVMGTSVFFPRKAAGYTQLREVYRTRDGIDSQLVTAHVPTYIPGDTIDICGDADLGFLAVLPDGGTRNEVYVFNFGALSEKEAQMAWHKWTFSGRVVAIDMFDGYLYLVIYNGSQVALQRINVASAPTVGTTHTDVGGAYTLKGRLSRMYLRDRSQAVMRSVRTQVRSVQLNYQDTGYLKVQVTPTGKTLKQYLINSVTALTGKRRIPVLAESGGFVFDILNDDSKGCAISSMEIEATYGERGQRL